jgi:hypothetical protein
MNFIEKAKHHKKEVIKMVYTKPKVLAQSTVQMAECRPNTKPSGRPCNPPKPSGR